VWPLPPNCRASEKRLPGFSRQLIRPPNVHALFVGDARRDITDASSVQSRILAEYGSRRTRASNVPTIIEASDHRTRLPARSAGAG
jgi:hypothetical protein